MNRTRIRDIKKKRAAQSLETALHSKRIRVWQPYSARAMLGLPSDSPSAAPSTTTLANSSASLPLNETVPAPSPPSPSPPSPSYKVPSPEMFLECGSEDSPRQRRRRRTDDIVRFIGSDTESDQSDEEVMPMDYPGTSRVQESVQDTPLDADDLVDFLNDPVSEDSTSDQPPATPADIDPVMTEMPRNLYDFEWREFPNPQIRPELRRETFSQINVGPTTPLGDPYDIFTEIWDRQIMEHIVAETNVYAQQLADQMLKNHILHPFSRIGRWQDITVDELYVYFAIVLAMGVVVKSRIEEYWSASKDIFCTPLFRAYMSHSRFILINMCLHFNNNNDMDALNLGYAEKRLFKIKPIMDHLNLKFQSMYTPAQNLALDESLLKWKGWLEFSQLIPNKVANRGIKSYEICESQTGYLYRFEIHANKRSPPQNNEDPLDAVIPSIVLRLVKGLEYKGYTLWMDNFYNSPCLARYLKIKGFDCVGTLRTDRKFVPQALHSLNKFNMLPGQVAGLTSGDVDVMVWRDRNRVGMISTYHGSSQQDFYGSTKPILILDYNIMMGGVDKKDQLLASYPVERKRTKTLSLLLYPYRIEPQI